MFACIEKIYNGEYAWIEIPNGDLETAISDFTEGKDWECVSVMSKSLRNSFHKCDIFQLNNLLISLEERHKFKLNDIQNLAVLNLLLEDRHHDCDEVESLFESSQFRVYNNAESMADVAMDQVNEDERWGEIPDFVKRHIDFDSMGESLLSDGNWLQDKDNKIIIEVFD